MIDLHPVNALVCRYYVRCRALTPTVASALTDLSWHPDLDVAARQLEILAQALGPMGEPTPRCPRTRGERERPCSQQLALVEARWVCPACGWPEGS